MRSRNILKIILLLCAAIFSYVFILEKGLLWIYGTNNLVYIDLLPILLPINVYLLKRKNKNKFIYLFSIINGIFLVNEIINMIRGYFEIGDILIEYFYLLIIGFALIDSILNYKKEASLTNDLLLCLVSFFIIVIHVRYYFDNSFLHNLMNITDTSNMILQVSYNYVTGYYGYFIIMFLIILVNQEIDSIKNVKFSRN